MKEVRAVKKNVAQVRFNNYPTWRIIIVNGTPIWQRVKVNV